MQSRRKRQAYELFQASKRSCSAASKQMCVREEALKGQGAKVISSFIERWETVQEVIDDPVGMAELHLTSLLTGWTIGEVIHRYMVDVDQTLPASPTPPALCATLLCTHTGGFVLKKNVFFVKKTDKANPFELSNANWCDCGGWSPIQRRRHHDDWPDNPMNDQ